MLTPAATTFLNLRLLSYWCVVVEEGSVTAAARRIGIPQPSLSQQIRNLEKTVGGELLERLPSGVRLTEAGRAFLPEAQATLASAERATRVAREALSLERGLLQIATYPSLAAGPLLTSVRTWRDRHPGVQIRMIEISHTQELQDAVERGIADVGVGYVTEDWQGTIRPIGWDGLALIMSPSDPDRRPGPIELRDLGHREWVMYDPRLGLAEAMKKLFAAEGCSPRAAIQTSQVEAAARLAIAGFGPALVPLNNLTEDIRHAECPLARQPVWRVSAFSRRKWSPAAAAYVEILAAERWPDPPPSAVEFIVD